ncbi:MAG: hypothetical protein AAB524_00570 [Patescibacteria group bacterium]
MAVFFLAASPSSRIRIPQSRYRRLEIICAELNTDYRLPRGTQDHIYKEVAEKLRAEGIEISKGQFDLDREILQAAYRWLNAGSSEEQEKVYKASKRAKAVLDCLIKDVLLRWGDFKLGGIASGPVPTAAQKPPCIRLEDLEAGKELAQIISELIFRLEAVLGENERLKTELQDHQQCGKRAADDQAYIKLVEEEIERLEARIRGALEGIRRAHSDTLEDIAQQHPELPQLTLIAQEMKSGVGRREREAKRLLSLLPVSFTWQNEKVYEGRFLDLLADLTLPEQEQIVKQVEMLIREGSLYASLHTRKTEMKLPHTPVRAFTSRGSDDLRFTWSKEGNTITIYWLFRKGDSRVRYSEH